MFKKKQNNITNANINRANVNEVSFFNIGINPLDLDEITIASVKNNIDSIIKNKLNDPDMGELSVAYANTWRNLTKYVHDIYMLNEEIKKYNIDSNEEAFEDISKSRSIRKQEYNKSLEEMKLKERRLRNRINLEESKTYYGAKLSKLKKKNKKFNIDLEELED